MIALLFDTAYGSVGRHPCLSFCDIEKAHRILGNVAHYNAPYYRHAAESIGEQSFYPLLLFTEALVYQADVEIEAAQRGVIPFTDQQPWLERQAILTALLRQLGLLSAGVQAEMCNLATYWHLENAMMYHGEISHQLVVDALSLRASDIMIVHHLLHQLLSMPFDKRIVAALQAWEILTEIECDLREYPADVADNEYNTYRMFVRLYRSEAVAQMEQEWRRRQGLFEQAVAALPRAYQEVFHQLLPQLHSRRPRPAMPAPILEPRSAAALAA